jgi:hypothetical protein
MARKRIQWHPLFTRLLRPHVEPYYEVPSSVPVGDLPRVADLLLLRRTSQDSLPFTGLWRLLTVWNLLEFKGATEAARPGHLPLLVKLGLGIARRLGEERRRTGGRRLPEAAVAFWYLANRLGERFRQAAERWLQGWQELGAGVWRGWLLGHPVYLVSTVDLPVDDDSLPLHVLAQEPQEQERQVGGYLVETPERLDAYASLFAVLHPVAWKEVKAMARQRRPGLTIDLRPAVEDLGLDEVIRQIDAKAILERMNIDTILANLPAAKRKELARRLVERKAHS